MGRQIHPKGFRLGVSKSWDSQWSSIKRSKVNYDIEIDKLRELIVCELEDENTLIGEIICKIKPLEFGMTVNLLTTREDLEFKEMNEKIIKLINYSIKLRKGTKLKIEYNHKSWENMDATLLSKWISLELEKGASIRALKTAIEEWYEENGKLLKGLRVAIKGRIQGAEIANKEWFSLGKVSLQTITNPIDYNEARAYTLSGVLGVKVWLI